jgi:hypothetical protein
MTLLSDVADMLSDCWANVSHYPITPAREFLQKATWHMNQKVEVQQPADSLAKQGG